MVNSKSWSKKITFGQNYGKTRNHSKATEYLPWYFSSIGRHKIIGSFGCFEKASFWCVLHTFGYYLSNKAWICLEILFLNLNLTVLLMKTVCVPPGILYSAFGRAFAQCACHGLPVLLQGRMKPSREVALKGELHSNFFTVELCVSMPDKLTLHNALLQFHYPIVHNISVKVLIWP